MGVETMGRVVTEATIENLQDLWAAEKGHMPADKVRKVVVSDALFDTGATLLSLPTRLIHELGLEKKYTKKVTSSMGIGETNVYMGRCA